MFAVTPNKGTYWETRQECFSMGGDLGGRGDLIMHNLGGRGEQYHTYVKNHTRAEI